MRSSLFFLLIRITNENIEFVNDVSHKMSLDRFQFSQTN